MCACESWGGEAARPPTCSPSVSPPPAGHGGSRGWAAAWTPAAPVTQVKGDFSWEDFVRPFQAGRVSPRGRHRGSETEAAALPGNPRGSCLAFAHLGGTSVSVCWERCFWAVVALPSWVSPGFGPMGLGSQVQVVGTEPARPVAAQGANWAPGSSRLHRPRTTTTHGVGLSTATMRRAVHPGPAPPQVSTLLPRDSVSLH